MQSSVIFSDKSNSCLCNSSTVVFEKGDACKLSRGWRIEVQYASCVTVTVSDIVITADCDTRRYVSLYPSCNSLHNVHAPHKRDYVIACASPSFVHSLSLSLARALSISLSRFVRPYLHIFYYSQPEQKDKLFNGK